MESYTTDLFSAKLLNHRYLDLFSIISMVS